MSVRAMTQVFRHSQSKLGARLVLLALADAAHNDGVTWIGQGTIAEQANLSEITVRRGLRDLESLGEVETRKAQRGKSRINVYRVAVPGLDDVDYDRLPFEVEPFSTTDQYDRSSDDRTITTVTTGQTGPSSPPIGDPEVEPRTPPEAPPTEGALSNLPRSVDRKPVATGEATLAVAVLEEWNSQTGQSLSSKDWLSKIIIRIREHRNLGIAEHAHIIAANLAHPWWKGHASPSVIYGNGAIFERAKLEAERVAPGRGMTPAEMERFSG